MHHPALPWREIGAFMQRLRQNSGLNARCLEFLILTACGEVRGATWSEIDLDHAVWTIPDQRRDTQSAGVPDVVVWYDEQSITVELKSRHGKCSRAQRMTREGLLRAGVQWWVCRSARSAMWALAQSGVPFRTIVHEDGTIERWHQPELPAWEVPKRDPHERRPRAPDWELDEIAELAAADAQSAPESLRAAPSLTGRV